MKFETGTDIPCGLVGETITPRCWVDGLEAHCLLDSGSQVTLICNTFFKRLNRTLHPLNDLVLFHGGDGKMPYLGWTYASMGFDDSFSGTSSRFDTFALVIPDGRNSGIQPVIVGTNSGLFRTCFESCRKQAGTQFVQSLNMSLREYARDYISRATISTITASINLYYNSTHFEDTPFSRSLRRTNTL